MAQRCEVCGKGPRSGSKIVRRGLEKKKGGIGLHTTGITKRRFLPNLQKVRAVIQGARRSVKVCASCLKAGKVVKA